MIKETIIDIICNVNNIKFLIVTGMFCATDFITGIVKAWRSHNIQSSKLKDGIGKLLTYFAFIMGIGFSVDFISEHNIGIICCSCIVCGNELVSIGENIRDMNLDIPEWIIAIFKKGATVETPSNSNFENEILNNPNINTYEDFEKYVEENTDQISLEELQKLLDDKE